MSTVRMGVESPRLNFVGPVVVRNYRAKNMTEASAMLAAEAQIAYAAHYTITSQTWAQGSWDTRAFVVALLTTLFFGLGLLLLAYLLIVKPDGTLAVTFTRS